MKAVGLRGGGKQGLEQESRSADRLGGRVPGLGTMVWGSITRHNGQQHACTMNAAGMHTGPHDMQSGEDKYGCVLEPLRASLE